MREPISEWQLTHFNAACPPNLWQLAQFVDPFSDWCGLDRGPGEICALAATERKKTRQAANRNVRTPMAQRSLWSRDPGIAAELVWNCPGSSLWTCNSPSRDNLSSAETGDIPSLTSARGKTLVTGGTPVSKSSAAVRFGRSHVNANRRGLSNTPS